MTTQRRQKKSAPRNHTLRVLCAVAFTVTVSAHAGIADDVANKSYGKVSSMTDMIPQVSGQGREDKAGGSKSQSNLGAVMATLAGSAMVAAAVPLLASINPIEVAAGAQLMAKAAQEFAQAAASSKTGSQNEGQQNLLTRVDENAALPTSSALDVQSAITSSLQSNAQLASLLQARGVDSAQFTSKLANGEVPDAIRGVIGSTSAATATPESQARVDQLVTQLTNSSFQKAMEQAPKEITVVESASSKTPSASGDSSAMSGGSVAGSAAAVGANAAGDRSPASADGGKGLESAAAKGAASLAQAFGGPGAGRVGAAAEDFSLDSLGEEKLALLEAVEKAFPGKGKEILAAQAGVLLERLNAAGVSKPVGRLSLFQLAHRNFRSYREWRLKKKKTTAAAERRGNQVPRQLANAR